jgi:hypothetical protein
MVYISSTNDRGRRCGDHAAAKGVMLVEKAALGETAAYWLELNDVLTHPAISQIHEIVIG